MMNMEGPQFYSQAQSLCYFWIIVRDPLPPLSFYNCYEHYLKDKAVNSDVLNNKSLKKTESNPESYGFQQRASLLCSVLSKGD